MHTQYGRAVASHDQVGRKATVRVHRSARGIERARHDGRLYHYRSDQRRAAEAVQTGRDGSGARGLGASSARNRAGAGGGAAAYELNAAAVGRFLSELSQCCAFLPTSTRVENSSVLHAPTLGACVTGTGAHCYVPGLADRAPFGQLGWSMLLHRRFALCATTRLTAYLAGVALFGAGSGRGMGGFIGNMMGGRRRRADVA